MSDEKLIEQIKSMAVKPPFCHVEMEYLWSINFGGYYVCPMCGEVEYERI